MSIEIIRKHLSIDQQYIKKNSRENPIKSKDDFYNVLKWWKKISKSDTISDLRGGSNNEPWIHVKIGEIQYYLNADTKRNGVIEFLNCKKNKWVTIKNENGVQNKIVNSLDESPISGFYFYKRI